MAKTNVKVNLIDEDGNAFAIMGRVKKELNRAGLKDEAKEYIEKCLKAGSYDELLTITTETVEVG